MLRPPPPPSTSNPLLSILLTSSLLILLYVPRCFLPLLLSPVPLSALFLLSTLLRFGSKPTPKHLDLEPTFDASPDVGRPKTGFQEMGNRQNFILERFWGPLEVIYEEEEEEGEGICFGWVEDEEEEMIEICFGDDDDDDDDDDEKEENLIEIDLSLPR